MKTPAPRFEPIHIEDVADCLSTCAATFTQLAALLQVIREKSPKHTIAASLAELGGAVDVDLPDFSDTTPPETGGAALPLHTWPVGLHNAGAALAQLAVLLMAIRDKSPEGGDAALLADLGHTVALDMQNFARITLEQLQKGGLQQ